MTEPMSDQNLNPKQGKIYTHREEQANAITHLVGLLFALVATVVLVERAIEAANPWAVVSFLLYGLGMTLSFGASTLYHWCAEAELKAHLRKADHAAIYFLIAGSYTPFMLLVLRGQGAWGWSIFSIVWALTIMGIVMNFGRMKRNNNLKTASYIAMGWLVVVAIKPLIDTLTAWGAMDILWWMAAAGGFYTFGAVLYALCKREFAHTLWHLMVLGGALCLFVAAMKIPI